MVLSKMYCSEQIVIPEKISNLLKTYAKGKKRFFIFASTVRNNENEKHQRRNALKANNAFQFGKVFSKHFL